MAAELPMTMAPPAAWTMRKMMISSAALGPEPHVAASATDASVKMMRPALYMRTRPNMSPIRPSVTTRAALTRP